MVRWVDEGDDVIKKNHKNGHKVQGVRPHTLGKSEHEEGALEKDNLFSRGV